MKKLFFFAFAAFALAAYSKDDEPAGPEEPGYYYKIVIVGSLDGKETGRVECMLADQPRIAEDWKKVDLSALGEIDCLKFVPESNDASPETGLNVPAYFAVDDIAFASEQGKEQVVSFEASEQMTDFLGEKIVVGDVAIVGGWAAGTYPHVYWADPTLYADYLTDKSGAKVFDEVLFSTADANVWFGSYYSDNANWGARSDSWGGFVVAGNYTRAATAVDYKNQFTVWGTKGANGTENCLIGYYDSFSGGYAQPTIELASPLKARYLYMANSSVTYCYLADLFKPAPEA